jgi:multidrug transporter EmrE-like cation transporter
VLKRSPSDRKPRPAYMSGKAACDGVALLIGVFILKERLDLAKVASTAMTLCGAIMLKYVKQS